MQSKVLVFEAPKSLNFINIELTAPKPNQVLVETLHSGISTGTELSVYRGTAPFVGETWNLRQRTFMPRPVSSPFYPLPGGFGYEQVGRVVELGSEVSGLRPGQLLWGAWGHRSTALLSADEARKRVIPESADPMMGVFNKIGAIAYNALLDTEAVLHETAVVFGLGVPGLLLTRLLVLSGVTVIAVDPLKGRRELALEFGASHVCAPEDVSALIMDSTAGFGADFAVEISGSYVALQEAIRGVRYNGTVVAAGFYQGAGAALNLGKEYHHNRVKLVCSQIFDVNPTKKPGWSVERLEDTFMQLQLEKKVDALRLISHRIDFSEAPRAYAMLDTDPSSVLQVVLGFSE